MKHTHEFFTKLLDTLTEQITVIDNEGNIMYVNDSWIKFSENNDGLIQKNKWNTINYLNVIDKSAHEGDTFAQEALEGIKTVIQGQEKVFYLEYPCHSPNEKRWFMMRATPFELNNDSFFVISHHNITQRKLAEDEVARQLIELKKMQNSMLLQSRQAAMGEMISMIAH